jgi:purine nucleoside phosphorylase
VRRVAAFASRGSLRAEVRPGDLVVPDDYLSFHDPPTFAEDEYLHVVPYLDGCVRELLIGAAEKVLSRRVAGASTKNAASTNESASRTVGRYPARGDAAEPAAADEPASGTVGRYPAHSAVDVPPGAPTLHRSGVYAETRGPRFETRAEVRLLAQHAMVVGMTAASEATLCQERGIGYGVICTVDNWANGVGDEPLTLERFQAQLAQSGALAREVLDALLALWRDRREE